LIDRSGGAADLGVPKAALATLTIQNYDPAECPLCKSGIPVVKPGSRSKPAGSKQKAKSQARRWLPGSASLPIANALGS